MATPPPFPPSSGDTPRPPHSLERGELRSLVLANWRDIWSWYLPGVHHAINNSLACIMAIGENAVDSLKERMPIDDDLVSDVEYMVRTASETGQWFQVLSRNHHSLPEEASFQDIGGLTQEIHRLVEKALPDYIQLQGHGLEQAYPGVIDPYDYRLMVMNLVRNAAEALPENSGGSISLDLATLSGAAAIDSGAPEEPKGSWIRVQVTDDGIGISPWRIPLLFQRDTSTKCRHRGLGLGLPITSTLAKQYGGALRITSSPGNGTTATLWLPAADESEDPEPLAASEQGILLIGRPSSTKAVQHALKQHFLHIDTCPHLEHSLTLEDPWDASPSLVFVVDPESLSPTLSAFRDRWPSIKIGCLLNRLTATQLPNGFREAVDFIIHDEDSDGALAHKIRSFL